jgi:hypothetical protein
MATVIGTGSNPGEVGVRGESQEAEGVVGIGHKGAGVSGTSEKWIGVYGESQEAQGVVGAGHKGAGVSGTSEKWIGVYGESQEAQGVVGAGHKGAGVSGTSEKWIGVYGESQEADGVRGVGHKGAGVAGTSEKWIGVYGKSEHLAGFFEGNLQITRDLIVNGKVLINGAVLDIAGLVQRIVHLEREVAKLKNQPVPPPPPPANYSISVTVKDSQFVLSGTGFQPNEDCYIWITYPNFSQVHATETADSAGKLDYKVNTSSLACSPGMNIRFRVNQPVNGYDTWSNEVTTSCP